MLKSVYKFLSPRFQKIFLEYKVDMRPRHGHGAGPAHAGLSEVIEARRDEYAALIQDFLQWEQVFYSIQNNDSLKDENEPGWNNDFLPGLDIVSLYGMSRKLNPKRYVEVGSGNSTKVVRRAIMDGELRTEVISVDPYPRASIDHLADKVIRKPVEQVADDPLFSELEAGDILFIDNSHRCLPNSDVTVCFLEILPRLKKGVIVQVHDIYMPYDYPQFMCDRAYSEQYVLAAMVLTDPNRYKPIFPAYFVSEDKELSGLMKLFWDAHPTRDIERHGGSFWLEVG